MAHSCPHCGATLPATPDAFCSECRHELPPMSDIDESRAAPPAPPRLERVGIGLVAVALVLPVVSGIVLLLVTSFGFALAISSATVLITSLLVALDARRLGNVDLTGRQRDSAGALFLGMCLLWIVVYPFAFFRRRHFERPNLALPATLVAVFFAIAPILRVVLIPPDLPSCTSYEVVQVFEQLIRGSPVGPKIRSIDGHRELDHDREAVRRRGQCVVHTDAGDIVVRYVVQWRERNTGQFEVRTLPPDLPSCTSQEVVQLLEQVIRRTPVGVKAKSIDGHREVSYDPAADRRQGQCVVHTDSEDIAVNYVLSSTLGS